MSANRKQKLRERAARLRERGVNVREVKAGEFSIQREVDHIVARAAEFDARCVTLGVLVFFSTETGDAWALDTEDSLAVCLARSGERQPVRIVETETQSGIEWDRTFAFDGDCFTTTERKTGRVSTIIGYPVEAILGTIQMARDAQA